MLGLMAHKNHISRHTSSYTSAPSYISAPIHSKLVFPHHPGSSGSVPFSHRLHYFSHMEKPRKASCMNKSWIKSPPTGQRWSRGQWRSNKHNRGSYLNVRGRPVASGYMETGENKRRQKQTRTPLEADLKNMSQSRKRPKEKRKTTNISCTCTASLSFSGSSWL